MTRRRTTALTLGLTGLLAPAAAADYAFTFSGDIVSGQDNDTGADLSGSGFTFTMFVLDLAANLTPGANAANYSISSVRFDLNSDGSVEETFTPDPATNPALYIDPGSTQLVGAFDLGGSPASFLFGVHLPGDAFDDPANLAGQSEFSMTGLLASSLNLYQSGRYDLVLDPDSFGFGRLVVVPLPPAALAGAGLLALGVVVRRVRAGRV